MGADIHPIAEVKENGLWRINTDPVFINPYFDKEEKKKPKDRQWDFALNEYQATPPDGRSYDWFSVLANVRNGYGFAGVKTGQGFDVIKEPKGFPDDISKEALMQYCMQITDDSELEHEKDENGRLYILREDAMRWVDDGYCKILHIDGKDYISDPDLHSESFITVEDFENFDWNQVTMKTGVISLKQYKELRGTNDRPDGWSGGVSGGNIITVSTDEADKILDSKKDIPLTREASFFHKEVETKPASEWNIQVQYSWSVLYSEWFERHINATVEPLKRLKEKYEDARMIIAFDN